MKAVIAWIAVTSPIAGQPFSDLKSGLVEYSQADTAPRKDCQGMASFKTKEIVQIHAARMAADATAPAHCRVTGVLAPEIAFEVSLPAKWNGRFYMIGNGGHAGEALDDPGRHGGLLASAALDVKKDHFFTAKTRTQKPRLPIRHRTVEIGSLI